MICCQEFIRQTAIHDQRTAGKLVDQLVDYAMRDRHAMRLLEVKGIDVFCAVPNDIGALLSPNFASKRLPQMFAKLQTRTCATTCETP